MNIQAEKIELIKLLLNTDNPKILKSIKQIFKKEKNIDFWEKLSPEQQYEIEAADLEIMEDKTTDYESFIAKHKK